MAGTFSVNGQHVTILFDSGASHTFISKECAVRVGFKIESMPKPYHIHTVVGFLGVPTAGWRSAPAYSLVREYSGKF